MENKIRFTLDTSFSGLLLESMADGVFTLNGRGEITTWNPAMERISGYSAGEAIDKRCTLLSFSHCFFNNCPTSIEECGIFEHGRLDGRECFLRHKDGYDVPVIKSARLVKGKNDSIEGIVETVTDLTELEEARRKLEEANHRLGEIHRFDRIIGKSHAIGAVFSAIKAAAASEVTILLQGESGTGKELVAEAIHYNSDRREEKFLTVNCSALPESLLESELFGHVRGAFTGAIRDRVGRFEEADSGTIFLDEIGEISPLIQIKLLRVLQEREIERVGESKKRRVNIRIIAATNRDLAKLVKTGEFRDDLYYRLKVFPIMIPTLSMRKEDIPLLVSHFIHVQKQKTGKKIKSVTKSSMMILMDYTWPGNVRELENAIEHAFVLCTGEHIDIFDLPVEIRQLAYQADFRKTALSTMARRFSRKELTAEILQETLHDSNWNKAEVGRRLGVSRTAIWKYMNKWDIPLKRPE